MNALSQVQQACTGIIVRAPLCVGRGYCSVARLDYAQWMTKSKRRNKFTCAFCGELHLRHPGDEYYGEM
jgi:hypothetical protein